MLRICKRGVRELALLLLLSLDSCEYLASFGELRASENSGVETGEAVSATTVGEEER